MESDSSRVSVLLDRLIKHVLPGDLPEPVSQKYHAYFLRILGSCLKANIVEDENGIKTLMQKRVLQKAQEDNTNKHTANANSLRLQESMMKINKMKVLQNKKGIYYMLYKISEFRDQTQNNSVSHIEALFQAREIDRIQGTKATDQSVNRSNRMEIEQNNSIVSTVGGRTNHTTRIEKDQGSNMQKAIQKVTNKGNANLDISESDLIRDILFAFQGIDGTYINYSKHEDSFVLKSTVALSDPVKKMVYQLCEMGWLFRKVVDFIQINNDATNGLIFQSFCFALKEELNEYYRLIAILDNLRESEDDQGKSSFVIEDSAPKSLNMRKLYLWSLEPFERLKWLAILSDACKNTKGGTLISVIYGYAKQGSPTIQILVNRILKQVLSPLSNFSRLWVYQGEIEDQYEEFFISMNPMSTNDALWTTRYKLNTVMIPCFIDQQIAESILLTGKTVNFLRKCCGVQDWVLNIDFIDISSCLVSSFTQTSKFNEFKEWISKATEITSQKLVSVLFVKFKFIQHCEAIKKYLLLGQGDFVQCLMDHVSSELSKPAYSIFKHYLVGTLETAIRASNAQFHNPEFLQRLDVKLLDASAGDYGWDIFSLDYKTEAPLNTIFNPAVMKKYLRLFNFLWRVKRVEHSLSTIWMQHMKTAVTTDGLKDLRSQMHKCNLLRHEMLHLVMNFLNYIMVEVIESAWTNLMEELKGAKDLNDIIKYHENFLNQILDKALLTQRSDPIYRQLLKIFDLVFRFKYTQEMLVNSAQEEHQRRMALKSNKDMMEVMDEDGESYIKTYDDKYEETRNIISTETVNHLNTLWKDYKETFADFMNLLKKDDAVGKLRFLNFRLDFNEYYCANNPKNTKNTKFDVDDFKSKNVPEMNLGNNSVINNRSASPRRIEEEPKQKNLTDYNLPNFGKDKVSFSPRRTEKTDKPQEKMWIEHTEEDTKKFKPTSNILSSDGQSSFFTNKPSGGATLLSGLGGLSSIGMPSSKVYTSLYNNEKSNAPLPTNMNLSKYAMNVERPSVQSNNYVNTSNQMEIIPDSRSEPPSFLKNNSLDNFKP
jgi:gamma-tubulin complex component 3